MKHPAAVSLCVLTSLAWLAAGAAMDGLAALPAYVALYAALWALLAAFPVAAKLFWGIVRGRMPAGWGALLGGSLVAYNSLLAAAMVAAGGFLAYNNEYAPARLPVAVLSNGEKTVTFRAMAHVATPAFYGRVQKEAAAAKASGALLMYEGVRPGTPENLGRLRGILGVEFGTGFYAALAHVAGLADQPSFPIAGVGSGAERNVDLSVDEVVAAYDRAAGSGSSTGAFVPRAALPRLDPDSLVRLADALPPRSRATLAYAARAAMNFLVRNEAGLRQSARQADPAMAAAILDARDRAVAAAIAADGHKDIYATYGLMHFQGVYDALRAADPRWDIVSVAYDVPTR